MSGVNDQGANYAAMDQQEREERERPYESSSDDQSSFADGGCYQSSSPPFSLERTLREVANWFAKSYKVIIWRMFAFFMAFMLAFGAAVHSMGPYYHERFPNLIVGLIVLLAAFWLSEIVLDHVRGSNKIIRPGEPWSLSVVRCIPWAILTLVFLRMLWMCYLVTQNEYAVDFSRELWSLCYAIIGSIL